MVAIEVPIVPIVPIVPVRRHRAPHAACAVVLVAIPVDGSPPLSNRGAAGHLLPPLRALRVPAAPIAVVDAARLHSAAIRSALAAVLMTASMSLRDRS